MTGGRWDAVVIGTGIGGGTAGRALAEAGLRVLFLEKGPMGHRTEETPLRGDLADAPARALRGFWPAPMHVRIDGHESAVHGPLGAGAGGSSVFYAATLERPAPHDFDDTPEMPHPTGGWPVRHAEMAPWLAKAEALYAVAGEADPLAADPGTLPPAPDPGPADRAIRDRLRRNGMHPYRMHVAARHLEGCAECFGRKCPRPCKMDGRSAGLEPALATGRAEIWPETEVRRLVLEDGRIAAVEAVRGGEAIRVEADRVILAAGALSSPRLLCASACEAAPEGIGNGADLVGRHLMFHLNEMVAVFPGRAAAGAGPARAIAFRDLYAAGGRRLGMVQALGVEARYGEILHLLRQRAERWPLGRTPPVREGLRLPATLALRLLGSAKVFVGLLEDLPDPANRVTGDPADPDRIAIDYRISPELRARRRLFRRHIARAFRGLRPLFLNRAPDPNLGHPCGTLRMGRDPATSVLDPACRVHGVANLWVTDASVFPTSMGVNPSLTIAANALRVADGIAR